MIKHLQGVSTKLYLDLYSPCKNTTKMHITGYNVVAATNMVLGFQQHCWAIVITD